MTAILSPNIVKSDLLVHLDFANQRSYVYGENLLLQTTTIAWSTNGTPNKTLNAGTAPDGTNTAISFSSSVYSTGVYTFANLTGGETYTYSMYVKRVSGAPTMFFGCDTGYLAAVNVNMSTGVATTRFGSPSNITSTNMGNDWYRISFSCVPPTTGSYAFIIYAYDNNAMTWLNWGPQIERSNTANKYVPTTSPRSNASATVTDLKNTNNLTLFNSPTYSSNNNGYINFYSDGSNNSTGQYAKISSISGWQSISTFIYIKDIGTAWKYLFDGRDDGKEGWFAGYGGTAGIGNYWTGMYINGVSTAVNWDYIPKNQWIHLYLEGNTTRNTALWLFSRISNDEYNSGYLGNFSMYSRKLSSSEILQNYNSLKRRYGL